MAKRNEPIKLLFRNEHPILLDGESAPIFPNCWFSSSETASGRRLRPSSRKKYAEKLADFWDWCRVNEINPLRASTPEIDGYLAALNERSMRRHKRDMAASTHNLTVAALEGFFHFLRRCGQRPDVPFVYHTAKVAYPGDIRDYPNYRGGTRNSAYKIVGKRRTLDFPRRERVLEFLKEFPDVRDRAIAITFWRTGLRVSELVALTVPQLLEKGRAGGATTTSLQALIRKLEAAVDRNAVFNALVVGKGGKERLVPIHPDVSNELLVLLETRRRTPSQNIFLSRDGNPIGTAAVQRAFRVHSLRTGIKLTPHKLRHGFAMEELVAFIRTRSPAIPGDAIDIEALKALSLVLGHSHFSTTELYWRYLSHYMPRPLHQ